MTCNHCGTAMTGRKRKYCDQTCSNRAFNARRKADGRLAEQRANCKNSRAKWQRENRSRYQEERTCSVCGYKFMAQKEKPAHLCSRECRTIYVFGYIYPKPAPREVVVRTLECPWCGVEFMTPYPDAIYCSKAHSRSAATHRHLNKYGEWTISEKARQAIYKKDQGQCRLCGTPVDFEAHPNADLAPSLDHIIPRSMGGSDKAHNLKTAHRLCNSIRGGNPFPPCPSQTERCCRLFCLQFPQFCPSPPTGAHVPSNQPPGQDCELPAHSSA